MIELRWLVKDSKFKTEAVLQYRNKTTVEHGSGLSTVLQGEWKDIPVVNEDDIN